MPDGIIIAPSRARNAGIERLWTSIGELYAAANKAEDTYGFDSTEADRATDRWLEVERKIVRLKGTDAAVLLMKLEIVAHSGSVCEAEGDLTGDAVRSMIRDLRAALGDAAPVPYSTLLKADGA